MIEPTFPGPAPLAIRPVRLGDLDQLHALRREPEVARRLLDLPSLERADLRTELEKTNLWTTRLVAERDGQLLGWGTLAVRPRPRSTREGKLTLAVHPAQRRRGVGRALLRALLTAADDWYELIRVTAHVFSDSAAALALLAAHDFEQEALLRRYAFADGRLQDVVALGRLHGVPLDVAIPEPTPRPAADPLPAFSTSPGFPGAPFIRPFKPEDVPDAHVFLSDPRVGRFTRQMPGTEEHFLHHRLTGTWPGLHRFVADVNGHAVGLASLGIGQSPQRAHAGGIGMSVHQAYWGQGIGTQLMAALCDLADNWLGLERLELEVNVDNPAGIRLYEKLGFAHEGIIRYHIYGDGRWGHSYLMGRVTGEG